MQLHRDGDYWIGVRIAGPFHQVLGLRFGSAPRTVEDFEGTAADLGSAADVVADAVDSVLEGTDLGVDGIRFVPTDDDSYEGYAELAQFLIGSYRAQRT